MGSYKMLRVKKDKLQKLEKFGFVHIDDNDFCMSIIIREKICVAVKKEGFIHVFFGKPFMNEEQFQLWNLLIYDLIQAGFIEKVEEV